MDLASEHEHGPHLDQAIGRDERAAIGEPHRLVEILRLDDREADHDVLRLCIRTVEHVAFLYDAPIGPVEWMPIQGKVAVLLQLAKPRQRGSHPRLQLYRRRRARLAIQKHELAHVQLPCSCAKYTPRKSRKRSHPPACS